VLLTQIHKTILVRGNGLSEIRGRCTTTRCSGEEIHQYVSLRRSGRFSKYVHFIMTDQHSNPASKGVGNIMSDRFELPKFHDVISARI
jgi:hypothetical protein